MAIVEYIPLSDIGFNPDNPRETITTDDLNDINSVQDMNIALVGRPYSQDDVGDVPEDKAVVLIDGNRRLTRLLKVAPDAQISIGEKINILPVTREEAYFIMLKTFFKKQQLSLKEECQEIIKTKEKYSDLSQRKLAVKLGISRSKLRDIFYILDQPEEIQEKFFSGEIPIRSIRSGSRDPKDEVDNVVQVEEAPTTPKPLLVLTKDQFAHFEPNYHKLCSEYKDLEDDFKEISFEDIKDYNEFHAAAHAIVKDSEYQEILKKYPGQVSLVTEFTDLSKAIFWLDPLARKEFEFKEVEVDLKDAIEKKKRPMQIFQEDLDHLKTNFGDFEIITEKQDKELIYLEILWFSDDEEEAFDAYLHTRLEQLRKKKVPKEERTAPFTGAQFKAFQKEYPDSSHSHQTIDEHVFVTFHNIPSKFDGILWILQNKDTFPLTDYQLERYTDVKPKDKVDLETLNKSYITKNDIGLIRAELGYNVIKEPWYDEKDPNRPKGTILVIWQDLAKKEIFENWTKDDRLKIIKDKKRYSHTVSCTQEILNSYTEKYGSDKIIETKKQKDGSIQILWWSISAAKAFMTWLKRQVPKIPTLSFLKTYDYNAELSQFQGRYFSQSSNNRDYEFIFWKSEDDLTKFQQLTRNHLVVTKQELECLQKHKPSIIENAEVQKKKKSFLIFHKDDSLIDDLETFLKPSRDFNTTGLEDLETRLFSKFAIEDIPIPLDTYSKIFSAGAAKAIEELSSLSKLILDSQIITLNQRKTLQSLTSDLRYWRADEVIKEEKSRRKGKQHLNVCSDCLQVKHFDKEQSTCSNCRATNEKPHLKQDVAVANSGGGTK
ncbi:MAG: hypothetical protein HZR80_21005 [Candidatus Heimdallarchaeota archaeon]